MQLFQRLRAAVAHTFLLALARLMLRAALVVGALLVVLAAPALAQVAPYPLPSPPSSGISFEQVIGIVALIGVPLFGLLLRALAKDRASDIEAKVTWAIRTAYNATTEWAAMTQSPPGSVVNKAAYAMEKFLEALGAKGVKPTETLKAQAALSFKALHGAEKKAEELAEIAGASSP